MAVTARIVNHLSQVMYVFIFFSLQFRIPHTAGFCCCFSFALFCSIVHCHLSSKACALGCFVLFVRCCYKNSFDYDIFMF